MQNGASVTAIDTPMPAREQTVGRPLAVVLGLLTIFGPISMDLYLPVLPALTAELQSTTSVAQLTITACLLGPGHRPGHRRAALGPLRPADAAADRSHRLHPHIGPVRDQPHHRDTHRREVRPGPGRRRGHRDRAGCRPGRLLGRQAAPLLRPPDRARRTGRHHRPGHRRAARNRHRLARSVPVPRGRGRRHPGGIAWWSSGRPCRQTGASPEGSPIP